MAERFVKGDIDRFFREETYPLFTRDRKYLTDEERQNTGALFRILVATLLEEQEVKNVSFDDDRNIDKVNDLESDTLLGAGSSAAFSALKTRLADLREKVEKRKKEV